MKKRVLVTGGTGFIGSHLVELLLREGYAVSCLVRDPAKLRWLAGRDVETRTGDCLRPETLASAVKDASVVIHAAGLTKARRAHEYYDVNHLGTRNLLEACGRSSAVERFILLSSQAAAGPSADGSPVRENDPAGPVSDYGRSKLLAEEEALRRKDAFPVVVLRPSVVYGPRERDLFEVFRWASRGLALEITGGERYLNFCFVSDLVHAVLLAAERPVGSGSIFFVAEERPYGWSEFRDALLSTGAVSARTLRVPYAAAYLIGLASEAGSLFTNRPALTNRQKVREASQRFWVCDVARAKEQLGFTAAYPLQRGLDVTWKWYRENDWIR